MPVWILSLIYAFVVPIWLINFLTEGLIFQCQNDETFHKTFAINKSVNDYVVGCLDRKIS